MEGSIIAHLSFDDLVLPGHIDKFCSTLGIIIVFDLRGYLGGMAKSYAANSRQPQKSCGNAMGEVPAADA